MNRHFTRLLMLFVGASIFFTSAALPVDPVVTERPQFHGMAGKAAGRPFLRDVALSRLSMDAIQEEVDRLRGERFKHLLQGFVGAVAMVGAVCGVTWATTSAENKNPGTMEAGEYRARKIAKGNWNDPKNILIGSLVAGVVGVTVTSFQRVFKLLAAKTEEILVSVFRGYKGWFSQEEEMLQGTLLELRESLHRARNNQSGREGSLYGNAEQVTYYRSDVISQYEYVNWRFQNLIALMYLMTPDRNEALLTNEVCEMISYSETFAAQLEKDCNTNTHGFWTKYSAETLMMFHAMTECMKEFITRFKVKLCR